MAPRLEVLAPDGEITYPTIFQAMAGVMADVGAVSKGDWNDHQKFHFRGIDSLHNAVYGPLCKHGVFVTPEVLDAHYDEVQTSQGKPARQATLTVRYRFHGPAGDHVDVVTVGEAMDSADKATNKAMAAAFKYALLQTFAIPTEGQDDADAESPQRDGRASPEAARGGSRSSERLATEKQIKFIDTLVQKTGALPEIGGQPTWPLPERLTFAQASSILDQLQAEPKEPKAERRSTMRSDPAKAAAIKADDLGSYEADVRGDDYDELGAEPF